MGCKEQICLFSEAYFSSCIYAFLPFEKGHTSLFDPQKTLGVY